MIRGYSHPGQRVRVFVYQNQALAKNCETLGVENDDLLKAQAGLAQYFHRRGHYAESEVLRKTIYERCRTKRGQADQQTLDAAFHLASSYILRNKLEDARSPFEMGHQTYRERLGENHPRTLRSMVRLANVIMDLGQKEEAERLCQLSFQVHEKCPDGGLNHPDTSDSARNSGNSYRKQGRYQEAEIMF